MAVTQRFEAAASATAVWYIRPTVGRDVEADLAGMEARVATSGIGGRSLLPSGRVQAVLSVALASSDPYEKELRDLIFWTVAEIPQ